MRTFALSLAMILASAGNAVEPTQRPVTFDLGPKAYRDGDVVQIRSVVSTSPRLEQGDTVTVRGRVRVDSTADAKLSLYLTQTKGDGAEETDVSQETVVKRGLTEFELTMTIKHKGLLHLTLYRTSDGRPIGGVYFGTSDQMASISDASVRHYLND